MSDVSAALEGLEDDDARARVLRWAAERYGVITGNDGKGRGRESQRGESNDSDVEASTESERERPLDDPTYEDFVDLFDAIDPKTDPDRALAGAYWLQVVQKNGSWQGGQVNSLLRDLGHGVGNITTAMTSLQTRKPALVRQMSKSGRSKQARKTYKLTTSGVAYVREKLGLGSAVPAALADHGED
jgi:hypothetical protein